jgi:hypothetical protein
MKLPVNTTRAWVVLAAVVSCAGVGAWAQESSLSGQSLPGQSLGDVARKTRKELASAGHTVAKKTINGDDDGPDGGGVWRIRLCPIIPCYELSITLPKNPKWSRAEQEPRPVLIPVAGHEEDSNRAIRVYAAGSSDPRYTVDVFKRTFLQAWFARPEYFGQSAQLVRDEHVPIDWSRGTITHFTITTAVLRYRGLSVVAGSPNGNYGFACVFREEDAAVGASICDAVVKSARYQELQSSAVRRTYPDPPDEYPNDDPPGDPPVDDDPE